MQNVLSRIKKSLADTHLYSLAENTLVFAEVSAYSVALEETYAQIEQLLPLFFPQYENEDCLKKWEKLFRYSLPDDIDAQTRTEVLLERFKIKDGLYNLDSCGWLLYVFYLNTGIIMDFDYSYDTFTYLITDYDAQSIFDYSDAANVVEKMSPAYVSFNVDTDAPTFEQLDGYDKTFGELNACMLPWQILKE